MRANPDLLNSACKVNCAPSWLRQFDVRYCHSRKREYFSSFPFWKYRLTKMENGNTRSTACVASYKQGVIQLAYSKRTSSSWLVTSSSIRSWQPPCKMHQQNRQTTLYQLHHNQLLLSIVLLFHHQSVFHSFARIPLQVRPLQHIGHP